ncbi:MAG: hypothetical protein AAF514_05350 [Verrucomicrobiota bacterium]
MYPPVFPPSRWLGCLLAFLLVSLARPVSAEDPIEQVGPAETEVTLVPAADGYIAEVTVFFENAYVVLTGQDEPVINDRLLQFNVHASPVVFIREPDHVPFTTTFHLGPIETGHYEAEVLINGEPNHGPELVLAPDPDINIAERLPEKPVVRVTRSDFPICTRDLPVSSCHYPYQAHVSMVFPSDFEPIDWTLSRTGQEFTIHLTIEAFEVDGEEADQYSLEEVFELGVIHAGDYVVRLVSNGQELSASEFTAEDHQSEKTPAILRAGPVVSTGAHPISVFYDGIDPGSLGDDDLSARITGPDDGGIELKVIHTGSGVGEFLTEALYVVHPPDDGWAGIPEGSAIEIKLENGAVRTVEGSGLEAMDLGRLDILFEVFRPEFFGHVEAPPITEKGGTEHRFQVFFESNAPMDFSTLGDDDLKVTSWVIRASFENGPPPLWAEQFARLVEVRHEEDEVFAEATYAISAPEGGWTEAMDGPLDVEIVKGGIQFADGTMVEQQFIGEILIDVASANQPQARMAISLDGEKATALVDVRFPGERQVITDWGEPRVEGHRIILDATSEPTVNLIDNPPFWEFSHRYVLPDINRDEVEREIKFETLTNFNFLRTREARQLVIETTDQWSALFDKEALLGRPVPAPPVDLEEKTILAVFRGEQPGNTGVQFDRVVDTGDSVEALATEWIGGVPPEDDAPIYPWAMICIPKVAERVSIVLDSIALPSPIPGSPEPEPLPEAPLGTHGEEEGPGEPEWDENGEPREGEDIDNSFFTEVIFRLNGRVLASGSLFMDGTPIDPGVIDPPVDHLFPVDGHATYDLGDQAATIHLMLDFSETQLEGELDWGEPEVHGNEILLNIGANLGEEPNGHAVVHEHRYEINDLAPGAYHLLVLVNDQPAMADVFVIPNGEEKAFDRWLEDFVNQIPSDDRGFLGEVENPAPVVADPGDFDADGIDNVLEYALGLNPLKKEAVAPIQSEWMIDEDGAGHLGLTYQRQKEDVDVVYKVEASPDLVHWEATPELFEPWVNESIGENLEKVTVCLKANASDSTHRYLRLRVVLK